MLKIHEEKLKSINPNLTIISQFKGGMSNFTYFCKDIHTEEKYVFRYPGDGSDIFVDFKDEQYNLQQISNLNISSEIIYNDSKGFKLSKYIEGHPATSNTDYQKVTNLLKTLHTSEIQFANNYNHLERLSKYEKVRNTPVSEEYIYLRENFINIFNNELYKYIDTPCHCDCQIANIIYNTEENNYYIIDWEFASTNDIIYDIASFGNIDFKHAIDLLHTYFEKVDNNMLMRLYSWRMFQALQWHNVAMYKHEIGLGKKLGLDFDKIADKYLVICKEMFNKYQKYI